MILWDKCCSPDSALFTPGFIFVSLSATLSQSQCRTEPSCRNSLDELFPQRVSRWQKATTLVLSEK